MNELKLSLSVMPGKLSVCRLGKDARIPSWASKGSFFSITKTEEELSIICPEDNIPDDIKSEKDWRAIKVEGPLDFKLIGVLSSLAGPLAEAKINILAISTFDTDYILVKDNNLNTALNVLSGFCIIQ